MKIVSVGWTHVSCQELDLVQGSLSLHPCCVAGECPDVPCCVLEHSLKRAAAARCAALPVLQLLQDQDAPVRLRVDVVNWKRAQVWQLPCCSGCRHGLLQAS
jgi:hypothetical protein